MILMILFNLYSAKFLFNSVMVKILLLRVGILDRHLQYKDAIKSKNDGRNTWSTPDAMRSKV